VVLGLVLIVLGVGLRIAAYGTITKQDTLTTAGVYSLCRHPLYLGSMLATCGFCVLFDDPANFVIAAAYFVLFYPLTIFWEEIRLSERYGAAHAAYVAGTPLIVPFGRYRRSGFAWNRAVHNGAIILIVVTSCLLGGTELLAEVMRRAN